MSVLEKDSLDTLVEDMHYLHAPSPLMPESLAAQRRLEVAEWIVEGVRKNPDYFRQEGSFPKWILYLQRRVGWNRAELMPPLKYAQRQLHLKLGPKGTALVDEVA